MKSLILLLLFSSAHSLAITPQVISRQFYIEDAQFIAAGDRGSVYKVNEQGTDFAYKFVSCETEVEKILHQREVEILSKMKDSPHITPILDQREGHNICYIKQHYYTHTLRSIYLQGSNESSPYFSLLNHANSQNCLSGIFGGLEDLHSQGIFHHDLKPDNIFVKILPNGSLQCILADLDNAEVSSNTNAFFLSGNFNAHSSEKNRVFARSGLLVRSKDLFQIMESLLDIHNDLLETFDQEQMKKLALINEDAENYNSIPPVVQLVFSVEYSQVVKFYTVLKDLLSHLERIRLAHDEIYPYPESIRLPLRERLILLEAAYISRLQEVYDDIVPVVDFIVTRLMKIRRERLVEDYKPYLSKKQPLFPSVDVLLEEWMKKGRGDHVEEGSNYFGSESAKLEGIDGRNNAFSVALMISKSMRRAKTTGPTDIFLYLSTSSVSLGAKGDSPKLTMEGQDALSDPDLSLIPNLISIVRADSAISTTTADNSEAIENTVELIDMILIQSLLEQDETLMSQVGKDALDAYVEEKLTRSDLKGTSEEEIHKEDMVQDIGGKDWMQLIMQYFEILPAMYGVTPYNGVASDLHAAIGLAYFVCQGKPLFDRFSHPKWNEIDQEESDKEVMNDSMDGSIIEVMKDYQPGEEIDEKKFSLRPIEPGLKTAESEYKRVVKLNYKYCTAVDTNKEKDAEKFDLVAWVNERLKYDGEEEKLQKLFPKERLRVDQGEKGQVIEGDVKETIEKIYGVLRKKITDVSDFDLTLAAKAAMYVSARKGDGVSPNPFSEPHSKNSLTNVRFKFDFSPPQSVAEPEESETLWQLTGVPSSEFNDNSEERLQKIEDETSLSVVSAMEKPEKENQIQMEEKTRTIDSLFTKRQSSTHSEGQKERERSDKAATARYNRNRINGNASNPEKNLRGSVKRRTVETTNKPLAEGMTGQPKIGKTFYPFTPRNRDEQQQSTNPSFKIAKLKINFGENIAESIVSSLDKEVPSNTEKHPPLSVLGSLMLKSKKNKEN